MRKISAIIAVYLIMAMLTAVHAVSDPLKVPNNHYGIHIADFNDLADVAPLINSNGGDWGYVTIVASDNDRDTGRWQKIFDQMRRLHLIPLVRLATHVEGSSWTKPNKDSAKDIANFLNNLNWPVANRYVIIYNEPNHAKEWGGTINPEEYADTFVTFAKELKKASDDFFILPAGLDVSAANDGVAMDAATYLKRSVAAKPEILALLDGWSSHSYPNPGFSGSPLASGRGTLRSFEWELNFLGELGLTRSIPVFITETGWTHSDGKKYDYGLLSDSQTAANVAAAASSVWNDPRVAAVTPFVFSYQDEPFDHFSWKKFNDSAYYSQYYQYQALSKTKGQPNQHERYKFEPFFPLTSLVAGSTYNLTSEIVNNGQGILNPLDGYELVIEDKQQVFKTVLVDPLPLLEPGEKGTVTIHLKTNSKPGTYAIGIKLTHNANEFELFKENLHLVPPPSLRIKAQLGWRTSGNAGDVTVLVYDQKDVLLEKFMGVNLQNGITDIPGLMDVVPGKKYRVVILVPFYLPRQTSVVIGKTITNITFKRLLPLDFNRDGGLTLADFPALIQTKPNTVISRFISP